MAWPTTPPPPLTDAQIKAIRKAMLALLNPLGPIVFLVDANGGLSVTNGGNAAANLTSTEMAAIQAGIMVLNEYSPAPPPLPPGG